MKKYSKGYKNALSQIEQDKLYSIEEAVSLVKKIAFEKFDSSITLSLNLNLNTTHADQQLRGSLILPNGNGKVSKILVVADGKDVDIAKEAKADYFGGVEMLEKIKNENWFDFDFIITTPELMPTFAKYGKLLGPKGLMPNPKLGTVTKDIKKAIENIKKGQIEYKTDKEGIVSLSFGKKSFDDKKLVENYNSVFNLVKSKRPASVKGTYIFTSTISSSMGPGIKVKID